MNWVYIESGPGLWAVGFYAHDGEWVVDSDYNDKDDAADRCAFLNGSRKVVKGLHINILGGYPFIVLEGKLCDEFLEYIDFPEKERGIIDCVRIAWDSDLRGGKVCSYELLSVETRESKRGKISTEKMENFSTNRLDIDSSIYSSFHLVF